MNELKQRGKDCYPFVYDENGLCEVRDPRAIELLGAGGVQASGAVCKSIAETAFPVARVRHPDR